MKEEIISISIAYGVISPFTGFTGPPVGVTDEETEAGSDPAMVSDYRLLGNFPNPFNPTTCIRFQVNSDLHKVVIVKIYNIKGELVKVLGVKVNGAGIYESVWDGTDLAGNPVTGDVYIYTVNFGDAILTATMVYLK